MKPVVGLRSFDFCRGRRKRRVRRSVALSPARGLWKIRSREDLVQPREDDLVEDELGKNTSRSSRTTQRGRRDSRG